MEKDNVEVIEVIVLVEVVIEERKAVVDVTTR